MNRIRQKKIVCLLSLIFIIVAASNSQKGRFDKARGRDSSTPRLEIGALHGGQPYTSQGSRYAAGHVLVKFKTTMSEMAIKATIAAYSSREIKKIPRLGVSLVQVPQGTGVEEMVYVLNQNPDVEYAEPDGIARITVTPNDPLFTYQYALYNSGQEIGVPGSPSGKARADIKATAAWEETKGDEKAVIAIVDTGVDMLHPDIKNKIKSSGRDLVNNDYDATDDHGHGTHVAGIAGAETNNSEGIAGVAWNCKILPVKVMDKDGSGLYSWIAEGITWAADDGADVINLSLGGDEPSQTLSNALRYAYNKNVVIVAATGNDSASVLYPAAYDDYCLAVAATDYNDSRPTWSNFGSSVDVAAPGERIASIVPTWYWGPGSFPYGFGSGTSAATPCVSGLAALIKSFKPWLKNRDIMDIIRFSADDVNLAQNPGKDDFIGYGRINMEKALSPIKIKK